MILRADLKEKNSEIFDMGALEAVISLLGKNEVLVVLFLNLIGIMSTISASRKM